MAQSRKSSDLGRTGGYITSGFERVQAAFELNCEDLGGGGGAFAAYVEDQLVVDLYARNARPGVTWGPETLSVLFSATKGLTTLCAQILADTGRLDIDLPVAAYWPEFARNGKEEVKVRHILNHTAGLLELPGYAHLLTWDGAGFDAYDEIARRLEDARLCWSPGSRQGYHAATFGWVLARLIYLITGKSLGSYFAEAVAEPLNVELRIGTPDRYHTRIPFFSDVSTARPSDPERAKIWDIWHDPESFSGKSFLAKKDGNGFDHMADLMNKPRILAAEVGGANATGAARDLARVYALLACGGTLGTAHLLSHERVFEWAQEQTRGIDAVSLMPWRWALGYHLQSDALTVGGRRPGPFGPNVAAAFGHVGYGGQVGGADPEHRVAVAFLRNELTDSFRLPSLLAEAVYQCL
jgi:CubicO group peptidase (beta-lactamase class C family)